MTANAIQKELAIWLLAQGLEAETLSKSDLFVTLCDKYGCAEYFAKSSRSQSNFIVRLSRHQNHARHYRCDFRKHNSLKSRF